MPPHAQTARLHCEKRARGKIVTVITGLTAVGNDLAELASTLKARCGAGGTVKGDTIELQGDHLLAAETCLHSLGYKSTRR